MDIKHVTIVDDDIDVFNPMDVEWAVATRVQADRDVVTLANARAKPLDPSLPVQRHGTVPTTAKMGIDTTISEGEPRERVARISSAYSGDVKIEDYLAGHFAAGLNTKQEPAMPQTKHEIHRQT